MLVEKTQKTCGVFFVKNECWSQKSRTEIRKTETSGSILDLSKTGRVKTEFRPWRSRRSCRDVDPHGKSHAPTWLFQLGKPKQKFLFDLSQRPWGKCRDLGTTLKSVFFDVLNGIEA